MPIHDALVHATPDGRWFETSLEAGEAALLRALDEANIERAVAVAIAGAIDNDFVAGLARRHPDRIVAGAGFDPSAHATPEAAARAVRETVAGEGFAVLKLHPRLNRFDLLDPRCLAALEEASSWPAPPVLYVDSLLYHRHAPLERPLVDTLHRLAVAFPRLRQVLLHAGGPWALQLAAAVRDCPHVMLDLSFSLHRYRGSSLWTDLRYLVETFDRRLLFGSDFPEVTPARALEDFRALTAGIDPARCDRVLGGNLTDLLAGTAS